MPLALFIPLLIPFLTELVKWFAGKAIAEVPPMITPLIAAAGGAALAVLSPDGSLDATTIAQGMEYGLAGTGLHQAARLTGLTRRRAKTRATDR